MTHEITVEVCDSIIKKDFKRLSKKEKKFLARLVMVKKNASVYEIEHHGMSGKPWGKEETDIIEKEIKSLPFVNHPSEWDYRELLLAKQSLYKSIKRTNAAINTKFSSMLEKHIKKHTFSVTEKSAFMQFIQQ